MVHKVLFWSGFGESVNFPGFSRLDLTPPGVAVRLWQLGIEMRPFFNKESLWAYPIFAGAGGAFGYWLTGVEDRQVKLLTDRRDRLMEKRRRRAEREGSTEKVEEAGILASTS
ncbi:hypothetical protein MMC20_006977 [Loxospora ochrophaea]|nr:hypothetical protein [Loxospora ochrophaea]